jgi:hypothetical protein
MNITAVCVYSEKKCAMNIEKRLEWAKKNVLISRRLLVLKGTGEIFFL